LAKTGYTNVEPAPSTTPSEKAGVVKLAQHNTATTIRRGKGWCTKVSYSICPDGWSFALARSRSLSGRSDARLEADLQPWLKLVGDFLKNSSVGIFQPHT